MERAPWRPEGAEDTDYFYDPSQPKLFKGFIEKFCRTPDGFNPGKPMQLLEWQEEFLDKFLGTVRWSSEFNCYVRQHQEAFVGISKKNGKTGFTAAFALAQCLLGAKEQKQNIIIVAGDVPQADIMFDAIADMILLHPRLEEVFEIRKGKHEIRFRDKKTKRIKGTIRVKSPDAKRLYGQKITLAIIDELVTQKDDSVYKALKSARVHKKDMMLVSITTAGYINQSQFCYEQWLLNRQIQANPILNTHKYVWIRETPLDVDPSDRKAWDYANPGFGVTKTREGMETLYKDALTRPSEMAEFKAMQLNQWVDGSDNWIQRHIWDNSGGPAGVFDEDILAGRDCFVGMDLSKGVDFSSVAYVFPGSPTDKDADGYTAIVRHWISEDGVKSRQTYFQTQCKQWADSNWLTIIAGNEIKRQRDILPKLKEDFSKFNVKGIGIDPYLANDFGETLENELGMEPVAITQNYTNLSEPTKDLEHCVVTQKFWHNLNPVLGWQIGCVVLDRGTQGDIKINKKDSSGNKRKGDRIDGIAAIINGLHMVGVKEEQPYVGFIPMGRR